MGTDLIPAKGVLSLPDPVLDISPTVVIFTTFVQGSDEFDIREQPPGAIPIYRPHSGVYSNSFLGNGY